MKSAAVAGRVRIAQNRPMVRRVVPPQRRPRMRRAAALAAIGLLVLTSCGARDAGAGLAPADPAARAQFRTAILPRYVPLASDEAIREYLQVTVAELRELRDRSYRRCHTFLFGDRADEAETIRLEATLSAGTRDAGTRATTQLVRSASDVPVVFDEASVRDMLDRVVLPRMPGRYRDRVVRLRESDIRMLDTATACDVSIDLYTIAIDLPPPEGSWLRRHLLARLATPTAEESDVE